MLQNPLPSPLESPFHSSHPHISLPADSTAPTLLKIFHSFSLVFLFKHTSPRSFTCPYYPYTCHPTARLLPLPSISNAPAVGWRPHFQFHKLVIKLPHHGLLQDKFMCRLLLPQALWQKAFASNSEVTAEKSNCTHRKEVLNVKDKPKHAWYCHSYSKYFKAVKELGRRQIERRRGKKSLLAFNSHYLNEIQHTLTIFRINHQVCYLNYILYEWCSEAQRAS